jgi:pyruvate dehydrogenase E2 component (dihydrolipoamide acetyltransferase)
VTKADVAAATAPASPAAAAAAPQAADEDKQIKVGPMRRAIAANMTKSWTTSPRVTFTRPVDATEMKALRTKMNAKLRDKGVKISYNHILMKVCAKALTEYPEINASFADNVMTLHAHVNMGLAVAKADGGLVVPNLKDCDKKSLYAIAVETEALIEAAKAGKLGMADMTGGSFTITNLGAYGLTAFSPIINQPELAILGVCAMVDTPVVVDGQVVIRPIMNLSLTADHRVVDGVQAAGFLQRIDELLEDPILLLA